MSLLAAAAVSFTACDDLEAPSVSSLDSESVFSQFTLAETSVLSISNSFCETNSHRGRYIPYYGINTDLEWINGMSGDLMPDNNTKTTLADKYALCCYSTSADNGQMNTSNNAYAKMYEGIERANQAIEGLRAYGNTENDADMAQLLGEALTLRAVYYLDLVKGWGDVPARFEPITNETMYMARTDRDEIYKQLLDDLEEAGELCYWPNESSITQSTERVSAAFAKALRARIALYAGGYSLRQDKTIRLSNTLDRTEMYNIAKAECVEIIEKGTNTLGEFKDNFTALCQDDVTAGKESLWELPFSDGRGRCLYTWGVQHQKADQYTQQAQGGVNGPLPYLFYDYDVDDVRRDITCVPYRWSSSAEAVQELNAIQRWNFGKLRYEWMNRIVTSTNDDGINWQYMRMADVYLMAAEAINELDGPSAAAQYLQPILDRALPADKVTAYMSTATASKDAFFNAIVDQRAFEFAGETLRKADLIRWNMLKEKLDEGLQKMLDLAWREGDYSDLPKKVWYKYADDGETLVIYGLNHGETDADESDLFDTSIWTQTSWISSLYSKDVDGNDSLKGYEKNLYHPAYNPDYKQYWPIWQEFLDTSNGMLDNEWLN